SSAHVCCERWVTGPKKRCCRQSLRKEIGAEERHAFSFPPWLQDHTYAPELEMSFRRLMSAGPRCFVWFPIKMPFRRSLPIWERQVTILCQNARTHFVGDLVDQRDGPQPTPSFLRASKGAPEPPPLPPDFGSGSLVRSQEAVPMKSKS